MKMKTLDNSTTAALPGALSLSREKYARYFGKSKFSVVMASNLPWSARHLPIIGEGVAHWTRIKEHLENGCLNPAKVICEEENLVASFTSLTAVGEEPTPVVKIWRERIDLIDYKGSLDGVCFAAASTYCRTEESWRSGCWSDFVPYVIDCLVDDRNECDVAQSRLKPLAWRALELGLENLDERTEGLYDVDVPHDVVWNAY
jgi:hypothetical protein